MHEETIEESLGSAVVASAAPAESSPGGTPPGDLPPGDRPPIGSPGRGRRFAAVALSALGVLVAVAMIAGFLVHLPYVIISPGNATPLDSSVVTIDGAPTYPNDGNVLFLTVRVSSHDPNVWKLVTSWLDPDREIVERESVVGCLSDAENVAMNARLMQQSQDDAKKVALERLGYAVTASPLEVTVVEACPGVPAYRALRPGDRIVAIDGSPVSETESVGTLVQARRPGDVVLMTVVRDGTTQDVEVDAGSVGADGTRCATTTPTSTRRACLGIVAQSFVRYDFPIEVTIDTARIGGPSAGLAFALAIVDELTPGDLTGGKRVAVTGAIASDGAVGPVGGVEQKGITARTQDVDLLLVPSSEVAAARRGAGDTKVVGVGTFDEALAALQRAGGVPVPPSATAVARS